MVAGPLLLAGLLPLRPAVVEDWGPCGAWQFPVGDRYQIDSASGRVPAFHENRGVEWHGARVTHQGTDLVNGRSGDTVRAAATGVVVRTESNAHNGYGGYIVLAHRQRSGELLCSVYAHLLRGSIVVKAGARVGAGEPIARVGQTGRASTPHLHFEIRRAEDSTERWENMSVVQPLPFLYERLAIAREDTSWARPFLEWAEYQALVAPDRAPEKRLSRAQWWRMLSLAARGAPLEDDEDPRVVRDSLIARDLLPHEEARRGEREHVDWPTLMRDLAALKQVGIRLPPAIVVESEQEAIAQQRFGERRPLDQAERLANRAGEPDLAEVCALLAMASGPYEVRSPQHAKRGKHPKHAKHDRPAKPKRQG